MPREIRNAKITKTMLGIEDHGLLTAFLFLDYGGAAQGFGGYFLRGPSCALFVERCLQIVGVDTWEQLPGRYLRADADAAKVHRIGSILEDRWFHPTEELAPLQQEPDPGPPRDPNQETHE